MEAVIHHFKLFTEGFRVPPGEVYLPIESPRGELGCFVLADGSAKPARVHMRDPSFVNLQAFAQMAEGSYIADMIATLAMLDPILGGIDDDARPDLRRPTAPRAGTRPADLEKDPAPIPDLARPRCRRSCARTIGGGDGAPPERHSAVMPALHAAQACTAGARPRRSTGCVRDARHARLPDSVASFYDMLETTPVGRHSIYACTNISRCCRAARRAARRGQGDGRRRGRRRLQCARLRVRRRL